MIVLELSKSLKIKSLEALLRRIPPSHPKRINIEEDLGKLKAGFRGEKSMEYLLKFLQNDKYMIFHNLRLPGIGDTFFEIDLLLVTTRFILINEIKNLAGTVYFDDRHEQMTRTLNDKEEYFPNPIIQVGLQLRQLQSWLEKNKFPSIPIYRLVVMTNSSVIIKSSPSYVIASKIVIHSESFLTRVEEFEKQSQKEVLTEKQIKALSRLFLRQNTKLKSNYLEIYELSEADLLKGVCCPKCNNLPMDRELGKWKCKHCSHSSKDAHLSSIKDYYLLISPTITNKQLRSFINIPSVFTASRLLASMKLPKFGSRKKPVYDLSKYF